MQDWLFVFGFWFLDKDCCAYRRQAYKERKKEIPIFMGMTEKTEIVTP